MRSYFVPALALLIILSLGFSIIYSTVPQLAVSQLIFILVGLLLCFFLSRLEPGVFRTIAPFAFVICLMLLLITLLIGYSARGSVRWIQIADFRFQTSEFVKPFLILAFAASLSSVPKHPLTWLLNKALIFVIPWLLIFFQPDLGSSIIIFIVWLGMLAHSAFPKTLFFLLVLFSLISLPFAYHLLKPYQQSRLTSFVNPYFDPSGAGYNVIQSVIAVGSGNFLGRGVRQGTQSHLRFLPERHTDFAFASFAEEFGFVGVSLLLAGFYLLLNWLLNLCHKLPAYENFVVIGVFWLFLSQLMINVGMNLGILPVTGITLPFVSYGGSSIISLFITLGIVFSFLKLTKS